MEQHASNHDICPIEKALDVIGKKWVILIVRELITGTKRYKDIENALGASPKMISQRLKELEEKGIVKRMVYPEIPPRVEYSLTEKGKTLNSVLEAMADWGRTYS
ncbi:MAG: helix-turn-helix transcriptional regulator [Bacillaceae bacterium]|nr:helix-turn-helix transcriptional regulator [Bacillaceae bacterium]